MSTVKDIYNEAILRIDKSDVCALLCDFLECDRAALLLKKDITLSEENYALLMQRISLAQSGMPIAYITGKKEFYSLMFEVSPDVLIPRPDTETLVDFAIQHAKGKRVLDICTGSGCIGISVSHYAPCDVVLLDISQKALRIAEKNAKTNGVNAKIVKRDILSEDLCGKYDLIISNPPYIESDVIPTLDSGVCDFEPLLALDGGQDGLAFYPVIIKKSAAALAADGILAVEVGHTQAEAVRKVMSEYFTETMTIKDLAGISRVIVGKRPNTYI